MHLLEVVVIQLNLFVSQEEGSWCLEFWFLKVEFGSCSHHWFWVWHHGNHLKSSIYTLHFFYTLDLPRQSVHPIGCKQHILDNICLLGACRMDHQQLRNKFYWFLLKARNGSMAYLHTQLDLFHLLLAPHLSSFKYNLQISLFLEPQTHQDHLPKSVCTS